MSASHQEEGSPEESPEEDPAEEDRAEAEPAESGSIEPGLSKRSRPARTAGRFLLGKRSGKTLESLRHMQAFYDLLESFLEDFAERWWEAGPEVLRDE